MPKSPSAETLLGAIPSDKPLAIILAGHNDMDWQRIAQTSVTAVVDQVLRRQVSFAYETVFSHMRLVDDQVVESKADLIPKFQQAGYSVALLFVGLTNPALSVFRVQ